MVIQPAENFLKVFPMIQTVPIDRVPQGVQSAGPIPIPERRGGNAKEFRRLSNRQELRQLDRAPVTHATLPYLAKHCNGLSWIFPSGHDHNHSMAVKQIGDPLRLPCEVPDQSIC